MIHTNFSDFRESLNEGRVQIKRKYGNSPAQYVNSGSMLRRSVLEFINSKGTVSKTELYEFLNTLTESIGKKPSRSWLPNNKHLIASKLDENGDVIYYLTTKGKRVFDIYKTFEEDDLLANLDDEGESDDDGGEEIDVDATEEPEEDEEEPEIDTDELGAEEPEPEVEVDDEEDDDIDIDTSDDEDEDDDEDTEDNDVKIEVNVNKNESLRDLYKKLNTL